jgi:hypothetical protein
MPRAYARSPSASCKGRLPRPRKEVVLGSFDGLSVSWFPVGHPESVSQHPTVKSGCSSHLDLTSPSCRQVMVLSGLIPAFSKAVPLLRLRGRWFQMNLNQVYKTEKDLQKSVTLGHLAKRDLQWIVELSPTQCSAPLWHLSPEDCDLEVQTETDGSK